MTPAPITTEPTAAGIPADSRWSNPELIARQAVAQRDKRLQTIADLTRVKEACNRAIDAELTRRTFSLYDTHEGAAVFNAMHDLTGCDELYDIAGEVAAVAPVERVS